MVGLVSLLAAILAGCLYHYHVVCTFCNANRVTSAIKKHLRDFLEIWARSELTILLYGYCSETLNLKIIKVSNRRNTWLVKRKEYFLPGVSPRVG